MLKYFLIKNRLECQTFVVTSAPSKIEEYIDKEISISSHRRCFGPSSFMSPDIFRILTDKDLSNYEAINIGLSRNGYLSCKMKDEKGKIFYGYRFLTEEGKGNLIEFLDCAFD